MKEGCGRINKHTHSMKLIYKKKSHIKVRFFCIFQKKAVPLQQFSVIRKLAGCGAAR